MSTIYRELAEIPAPTAARFVGEDVIQATFSTRDHVKNERRTTTKTYLLSPGGKVISGPSVELNNVVLSSPSPSGEHLAVLREESDSDGKTKKRLIQVWKGDVLEAELDVTEKHGAFYGDEFFSSLSFSPSGNALLYTAEENPPKSSFDDEDPFKEFTFTPKLGEGLPQRCRPHIFIFRWTPGQVADIKPTVEALKYESDGYLGQAVFVTEERIFATGYDQCSDGRLLGAKFCTNRPSALWEIRSTGAKLEEGCTLTKHENEQRSARSPRVLQGKNGDTTVFWLSSGLGGAHGACASIHSLNTGTNERRTLVKDVQTPGEDGFPGLYPEGYNLAHKPFMELNGEAFLAVSSFWGSRTPILLVNIGTLTVRNVTPEGDYHWSVLGTDGKNRIIASRSSLVQPPELVLGEFNDGQVSWSLVHKPPLSSSLQESLRSLELSIIQIPNHHPVETILLRKSLQNVPQGTSLAPLVTAPHGGPHSCTSVAFSAMYVARALEGYTMSFPNYTGSTGYGQKYVDTLLGRCGSLDVGDCMASIRHLIDIKVAQEGPGKQLVAGGSHGGFLTAHLIGQYPGFFSAAAMRNPVIDMGAPSTSDILDWYYAECGFPFTFTNPPLSIAPAVYEAMWKVSPIAHVDKVKTPVLIFLGNDDQRVAPTQGFAFYYALKGLKQDVKLLCFPGEGHSLDGVRTARVTWEAERKLFQQHSVF